MGDTEYFQPFIRRTPLDKYPKIKSIIESLFTNTAQNVRDNIYNIFSAFLTSERVAISRTKSPNQKGIWHSYSDSIKAQDLLLDRGLITISKGYRTMGFSQGFSTVISSTRNLDDLLEGIILKAVTVDDKDHPILTLDRKVFTPEKLQELSDQHITHPLSKEVLNSRYQDLLELNVDYFSRIVLGFTDNTFIRTADGVTFNETRQVTSGDMKLGFNMATNVFFTGMHSIYGCGRLYQRCDSYQTLNKRLRDYLTINGEEVSHSDYSSMHVNLAYFVAGKKNPFLDDSYSPIVESLNLSNSDKIRTAVKRAVLIAFNSRDKAHFVKAMNFHYKEHIDHLSSMGVNASDIYEATLKVHNSISEIITSSEFKADIIMFYESSIMMNVLKRLRNENIFALPLHDETIYSRKDKRAVDDAMFEEYQRFTGNRIIVK